MHIQCNLKFKFEHNMHNNMYIKQCSRCFHSNGSAKYLFSENALKITPEYFLKFLFLFESTILPVNNGK